jgi:hypothetical protein
MWFDAVYYLFVFINIFNIFGQEHLKTMPFYFLLVILKAGRSQWTRCLRRRSTAARLQRSWVRIPRGHGSLSVVSVVCCQVEVSATSWSLDQRSPTNCDALCVWSRKISLANENEVQDALGDYRSKRGKNA